MSGLREYHYDLHIHTCLSPCGDSLMTPCNISRMAALKGLDIIAATDHNSCLNCGAVMEAGAREGLLVLPGMELCTRENIHVVCLFETLSGVLGFSGEISGLLPEIRNRPEIFGEQTVMNARDEAMGSEERFLLGAASVRFDRVQRLAFRFGGAAFPAHADREAFGVIGVLGSLPPDAGFSAAELSPACDTETFLARHGELLPLRILKNSDAHFLGDISERGNVLPLPELSARAVIRCLCGGS